MLPLITLAYHLKLRSHDVTFAGPVIYAEMADRHDLNFVPLSTLQEHERSVRDFFLCSTRYGGAFLRRHAVGWNHAIYRAIQWLRTPNFVILASAGGLLWADRLAHVQFSIPALRMHIDPPMFARLPRRERPLPPSSVQRELMAHFDLALKHDMRSLGVNIGPGFLTRIALRAHRTMGYISLFPAWLIEGRKSDSLQHFGFLSPLSPKTNQSLGRLNFHKDRQLLVFMAGSDGTTTGWSARFGFVSMEACRRLRCSAIFLGGSRPNIPDVSEIAWRDFAPLRDILPHASVIVHHGGIGTAGAALQYGIPQVIIPRFGSQASNAEWLKRLGVCVVLKPHEYTPDRAAAAIAQLSNEENSVRNRSLEVSRLLRPDQEADRICDFLEHWYRQQTRTKGLLPINQTGEFELPPS